MDAASKPCLRGRVNLTILACLLLLGADSTAQELAPYLLGGDLGSMTSTGLGAYSVTAQGTGVIGGSDQIAFAAMPWSGDFDVQVRVADLDISNPLVRAGVMVRASTNANSAFCAAFSSSALAGCFCEYRPLTGSTPQRLTNPGGFPAAPPNTWMRLRRESTSLSAFASVDGSHWTRLAQISIDWPAEVFLGLAVSSQNRAFATRAQFANFGPTVSSATSDWLHLRESATPSSRRTGLVISEIQYHPFADAPGQEFIEIANHGDIFQDMTGWRLTGGVEFRFPPGFRLEAGAFVVVAEDPAQMAQLPAAAVALGPWSGKLNNAGDLVELRDNQDAIRLHVKFSPDSPWPVAADGTGHSLVLASPSYGENDPRAWTASWQRGGSPGRRDPISAAPLEAVVINEFLAHTDLPEIDFVELYNRSTAEVDLSGWIITDDIATNRFRIPEGIILAPGTALVFDERELGFRLDAAGESVYLLTPNASRVVDVMRFRGQENGVASGRCPDGSEQIRRLARPTPGTVNAPRRLEDIVINEIFYNPPAGDDDEYIELFHRGGQQVDLGGWRLRGGVDFEFPPGTMLRPGDFLVVARNQAQLRQNHPTLPASSVAGNYSGTLNDGGDIVRLDMPDEIRSTNALGVVSIDTIHITVGEVRYYDGGAWGKWSDGGGSSLELTDPAADPALAANWADSDESNKAAWTTVEWTGRMANGTSANGINRLYLGLLNDGECLVDDVEVFRGSGTNFVQNPGFETGSIGWLLSGNHAGSTLDAASARNGGRGLHIRAQGGVDTGINSVRGTLYSGLANGDLITIRASVRWLAGWPELLFRIRGNYADFGAPLPVPRQLGTPGRPNSRLVPNVGPALYEVSHSPALPRANDAVRVTARASDADGVSSVTLRFRLDPGTALTEMPMRDDGLDGDVLAGDGLYTAVIPARAVGLVAFTLAATDSQGASSVWPSRAPLDEGLIRWADPIPFTSFPHVHLWATSANRSAAGGNALNNAYRRCTLVYGNTRVIYNALFRDKSSPYHNGLGDMTARLPDDDKLHGVSERVFAKTGNGGTEETGLRGRVAAWLATQMGVPALSGKYQMFYLNGSLFANVVEDLEEPDHRYAEDYFPDNVPGDLYKISVWFEFADNNSSFTSTSATMERFLANNALQLARYRWNWERRAQNFPESTYPTIFDLVTALNSAADSGFVDRVLQQADMDQWMHVFAFHRVTGNWDSWTYSVGQNMYLYRQPGRRAVLLPWDVDFVFGLGDATTADFWGGQDSVMNTRVYNNPAFRRMLWRALAQAADGPMQPQNYLPVVEAYRAVQIQNNISSLASISSVTNYINGRRATIQSRYRAADTPALVITSNGGADFTSATALVTLTGAAPLRVADIAINGARYPVTWTGFTNFSVTVPLTAATNDLRLVGLDAAGHPLADVDTVRVIYPGAIPQPSDWVIINEIHYNPAVPGTSFVELHNRHTTVPFNLSGYRLDGLGYTFPANATIPAGGFLVLAANRSAFTDAFGTGVAVFDEFTGSLDNNGERLRLLPPDSETAFSVVRYDDHFPWPSAADGQGASLQLIDPAQDTRRPANWAATATNAVKRVTPGAANATLAKLAAFPDVWINEIVPQPNPTILDNAGEVAPYVEIYNTAASATDLTGLYLSDGSTNLARWPFPAGTSIPAAGFLRVWLDGQSEQTAPGHLHASFALPASTGSLFLSRYQGSPAGLAVLDSIAYESLPPERGFGSVPDGDPFARRLLYVTTPGATNDGTVPAIQVVLNEIMAANTAGLTDPADGKFEDWIELYNPGALPADLAGYFLTDNLTNRTQSQLPPGTIVPAGGLLLIWADGETGQTDVAAGRFHVNFSLAKSGEQVGLFAPNGSLVDGVTFGTQTNNIAWGRYPDGPDGAWNPLDQPTPGGLNFVAGGNLPPRFSAVPVQTIPEDAPWSYPLVATDPDAGQTIRFSLGNDAPAGMDISPNTGVLSWTPDERQGPGVYSFTVRATDDGAPPRTGTLNLRVQVTEANRPPELASFADVSVGEGSLLAVSAQATDPDWPAQSLRYDLIGNIPSGASIDPITGLLTWVPMEAQGPGDFDVVIQVSDSGSPSLSAARTLHVHVEEVDNPPVFLSPGPQAVDEGSLLTIQLNARDPDGGPVRYSFLNEPPPGLALDADSGVIRWIPEESQGPGSYPLLLRATEVGGAEQSAQATFSILVREVNATPTLDPWPVLVRQEGDEIELQAKAADADQPAQTLTFSLEGQVPGLATIDPVSGALRWKLPDDLGRTNLSLIVKVTDDASSARSAAQVLTVEVLPKIRVRISEVLNRPIVVGAAFIELLNPSALTAWDLSGAQLMGRHLTFTMPVGTILGPGATLCVTADTNAFRSAYGSVALAGAWVGSLDTDTDDLRLVGPQGELLHRLVFRSSAPWPDLASNAGSSLQLIDSANPSSAAGNWTLAAFPRQPVAYTSTWRYLDTSAPSGSWAAAGYDDRAWKTGAGLLYWEDAALPAAKTTSLTLGQLAYYFRTEFVLPAVPSAATLSLSHIIDDAAVFYLNGTELARFNFSAGTAMTPTTLAEASVGNAVVVGPASVPAQALRAGTNTLAVEVHQVNSASSDVVLGAQLDLAGNILAATPGAVNNVATTLAPFPELFLNELAPVPGALHDSAGESEPWVELLNAGSTDQSLTGWTLTSSTGVTWAFPANGMLRAGERRIVFLDGELAEQRDVEWHASFRPAPANGWLALVRPSGVGSGIVDSVYYGSPVADATWSRVPETQTWDHQWTTPTPALPNPTPRLTPPALAITWTPVELILQWVGDHQVRYRVEAADRLEGPWNPLSYLVGSGVPVQFRDKAPAPTSRFYRIAVE